MAPQLFVITVACAYVLLGSRNQWDFETYYYAAKAYLAGLNPYDLTALSLVAGRPIDLPFVYPPVALFAFLPLCSLPMGLAGAIWLSVKAALLVALAWLWRKNFLAAVPQATLLIVTLLGFDLAALWDLRTGNVATIEAVLLWLAFSQYLVDRPIPMACLIVLASVFKIAPAVFLGLLFLPSSRPLRLRTALAVGGVILVLMSLTFPADTAGQWARAASALWDHRPLGDVNPSALGVIDSVLSGGVSGSDGGMLGLGVYLVYAIGLLTLSLPTLRRVFSSKSRPDHLIAIVLLWLLLAPRVMIYTYIMAIPVALFVVQHRVSGSVAQGAAVGILIGPGMARLAPGAAPAWITLSAFFVLLLIWLLWIRPSGSRTVGFPCS